MTKNISEVGQVGKYVTEYLKYDKKNLFRQEEELNFTKQKTLGFIKNIRFKQMSFVTRSSRNLCQWNNA